MLHSLALVLLGCELVLSADKYVCVDGQCAQSAVGGVDLDTCKAVCIGQRVAKQDQNLNPTFVAQNASVYVNIPQDKDLFIAVGAQAPVAVHDSLLQLQLVKAQVETLTATIEQQQQTIADIWDAVNKNKGVINTNGGRISTNDDKLKDDEDKIKANGDKVNTNFVLANKNTVAIRSVDTALSAVNASLHTKQMASLQVLSAGGCEKPTRVEVTVDGVKQKLMNNRGIHLYVFSTSPSLKVVFKQGYDTYGSANALTNLINKLNTFKEGQVIALGVRDAMLQKDNELLFKAIEQYGCRHFRSVAFREGVACVGVKGAPLGSVAEDDGGTSTGGTAKTSCGGKGRVAVAKQMVYTDRLSSQNLMMAKAMLRFKTGSLHGMIDTHRYIKSGKIVGGGDWPKCTDKRGYLPIARVFRGAYHRYIKITVIGSHRGYNRGSYMEYEEDIITCGDKCSSFQLQRRGSHKVQLWNEQKRRPQYELFGNGDVDIHGSKGYMVMLSVDPQCGSNLDYTYHVEAWSDRPESLGGSMEFPVGDCYSYRNNAKTAAPYYLDESTNSCSNKQQILK